MKATWIVVLIVLASAPPASQGAQSLDQTHQMESSSDSAGARIALARAVQRNPGDVGALTAYAEFLDRYGDLIDRVTFYTPYKTDPERWKKVLAGFKSSV